MSNATEDGGLTCPVCGGTKMVVTDSRPAKEYGGSMKRRRECANCKHRYSTYEIPAGRVPAPEQDAQLEMAKDTMSLVLMQLQETVNELDG